MNAGTRLVWVVDPVRHAARVYRSDGSEAVIPSSGRLCGEDVIPGFDIGLTDLFRA